MRRLAVIAILLAVSACTPNEIAAFRYVQDHRPTTCHAAVDMYWPASSRGWAHRIVQRESTGNAGAQNRHSSAAGCFGIIRGTWNAQRTGIPWSSRYDPVSNTQVALVLYQRAGTRPWR